MRPRTRSKRKETWQKPRHGKKKESLSLQLKERSVLGYSEEEVSEGEEGGAAPEKSHRVEA